MRRAATASIATRGPLRQAAQLIDRGGAMGPSLRLVGYGLRRRLSYRFRRRRQQRSGHGFAFLEMFIGRARNVLGADFHDRRRPIVDLLDRLTDQQTLPVAPGELTLAIGLVNEVADEGLLCAAQLALLYSLLAQLAQRCVHACLHLVEPNAFGGDGIEAD